MFNHLPWRSVATLHAVTGPVEARFKAVALRARGEAPISIGRWISSQATRGHQRRPETTRSQSCGRRPASRSQAPTTPRAAQSVYALDRDFLLRRLHGPRHWASGTLEPRSGVLMPRERIGLMGCLLGNTQRRAHRLDRGRGRIATTGPAVLRAGSQPPLASGELRLGRLSLRLPAARFG
jgi:hypothetical protein